MRAGSGLLISTHGQPQAQGHHLDAQPAKQQLENSLNSSKALSEVAKNQQTDPLDVLDSLKTFIENIEQQDKRKASAFKSALMILSAPDSIALSSQQDIHVSASQQISQTAGGSINLSTQNNLIAQASDKISLFAAQKGISAIAAKGKIQLQAQDDALELIARKVIQIISTEDNIALTSAKEIVLTGGSSQIKINGSGVLITTGGKFESKAAQHVFNGGERISSEIPSLPNTPTFSNRLDVYDWFWQSDFSQLSYKAFIPSTNTYFSGKLDEHGHTGKISTSDSTKVQVLIGFDEQWGLSVEGFDEEDFINNQSISANERIDSKNKKEDA